jgi:uncharacterized membrane protein YhaH (DUF805 family)
MRGVILAIAPDGTYGQISADDGQRYSYWTSEIRNGRARAGDEVDFQMYGDQPVDIFLVVDRAMPAPAPAGRPAMRPRVVGPQREARPQSDFIASLPPLDYWIKLFTTPKGRIARREFWLFGVLPIFVVNLLLAWIPLINILVMFATLWASVCICFKRFHDCGYAGWWSLLNIVPSVLASALAMAALFGKGGVFGIAGILWLISLAILIGQIVFVYARIGQPGPNKYGPDPLAAAPY